MSGGLNPQDHLYNFIMNTVTEASMVAYPSGTDLCFGIPRGIPAAPIS